MYSVRAGGMMNAVREAYRAFSFIAGVEHSFVVAVAQKDTCSMGIPSYSGSMKKRSLRDLALP